MNIIAILRKKIDNLCYIGSAEEHFEELKDMASNDIDYAISFAEKIYELNDRECNVLRSAL